ncbi:hypothetical protein CH63R_07600 [Colletotrichum higginsianum IMI 349063]|uniref:Uncharacterized protein n=1 Tax=Colletotrichum higginsianum (strain IMI 349063) TaxID=759273 RepID=A0A1B7YA56_COLHI|nr:hypothetical protein CH63R_07600 [Colletotrichum higginsianum IMI 349063]OBR08835.1 hypothetical protein CH63R_07600 [Colletotrichum higginsianum IMI 349063]
MTRLNPMSNTNCDVDGPWVVIGTVGGPNYTRTRSKRQRTSMKPRSGRSSSPRFEAWATTDALRDRLALAPRAGAALSDDIRHTAPPRGNLRIADSRTRAVDDAGASSPFEVATLAPFPPPTDLSLNPGPEFRPACLEPYSVLNGDDFVAIFSIYGKPSHEQPMTEGDGFMTCEPHFLPQ